MSQDPYPEIFRLLYQCHKKFKRLRDHRSDIEVAPDWKQACTAFKDCFAIFLNSESATPLIEVPGGIDRYPNTASLLMDILRGLEQNLVKTVAVMTKEKPEGPNPRGKSDQSIKILLAEFMEETDMAQELHRLYHAIMGSVLALCVVREHVCPPRSSLLERYHDHRLTAYEDALASTIQQKKESQEAQTMDVPEGGTEGEKSDSTNPK